MLLFTIFNKLVNLFIIWQVIYILKYMYYYTKKYFFTHEINLEKRYGGNSWVLITGCGSGQGERFALEFAKRNFNIILVGNKEIEKVEAKIKRKYGVKTITYITNFCDAFKEDYFEPYEKILDNLDGELSILVNNVGHRVAWNPYHEMPSQKINDTIVCGTIIQSRLTQIAIKHFMKRKNKNNEKSGIINITAMCMLPSFFVGTLNYVSVPYLSAYEGANAFGFYHSNSIQKEYSDKVDVLNITPGAVITKNIEYIKDVTGAIDCKSYVRNIFKLIGNYTGPQHAYWKHELTGIGSSLYHNRDYYLNNVGTLISEQYMKHFKK